MAGSLRVWRRRNTAAEDAANIILGRMRADGGEARAAPRRTDPPAVARARAL